MSAGSSSSSGQENARQSGKGTREGNSQTASQQNSQYDNTTQTSTKLAPWAQAGNKNMFEQSSADDSNARDFLTGLLSNPLDAGDTNKNRYSVALDNMFKTQLANSRTGDAQNMGAARQGYREAQALTDAQTSAIGTGTNAATALLGNSQARSSLDFAANTATKTQQGSGTASNVGTSNTLTNEETDSSQKSDTSFGGTNDGYGITICCFIFLESYHGQMPWYVRRCRDEFASGPRVEGYRRMAEWLVPLMRKSAQVSCAVWHSMVRPMTKFGGWLYDVPGNKAGWLYAPVVAFWFGVWKLMGKEFHVAKGEL